MLLSVTITPATDTDVEAILALLTAGAFRDDGSGALLPLTREQVERLVAEGRFVVAKQDDDLAGCVSLVEYGGIAELRSLVVAGGHRGRGVGTQLAQWCIEEATRRGHRKLYALTNADALPALQRWGFTTTDRPPEKLSRDCRACPLFHANACKELAVVRALSA